MQLRPHTELTSPHSPLCHPPARWAGLNGLGCYQSCEDPSSVSHQAHERKRQGLGRKGWRASKPHSPDP